MTRTLLVFCGGACGAALRAVCTTGGHPLSRVWAVNVVGALVLGALLHVVAARSESEAWRRAGLLVGTGLCGGFTTYSTFAVQGARALGDDPAVGALYGLATLMAGAVAAGIGMGLAALALRGDRG